MSCESGSGGLLDPLGLPCKCCCPVCAVLLHEGCSNPINVLGACCFDCLFTVLCWQPSEKQTGYGKPKEGGDGGKGETVKEAQAVEGAAPDVEVDDAPTQETMESKTAEKTAI